jgi:16S rRNA (cytosine967-C5)-methyltransferase
VSELPGAVQDAVKGGVTEARVRAADVCADLRRGELLDQSFERRAAPLDARDRRWMQELVYGMLRTRSWLDAILILRVRGGLARLDPDLIDLLRLGTYQLLCMRSVPAYAAIAQTVELAKRRHGMGASKLVNAVLRRTDRERENLVTTTPRDAAEALAVKYSHPQWIVARWMARFGVEATERLLQINNTEPHTVLRPFNVVHEQLESILEAAGVQVIDAPLARNSIQLAESVNFMGLGAFRQGLFFVQDPAATLVTQYAAIASGAVVADLCAAPGGKAIELSRCAKMVVAGDRSLARLDRVRANLQRLEIHNIYPIVADARHPAVRELDVVLIDVPCTGTGTFRRHPDARWRLKVSDIAVMAAQQLEIIEEAVKVVAPGGLLIYSTCTLEPEENEEQMQSFLVRHPEFVLEPPPEGAVPPETLHDGMLRVLPHVHGVDGAFAARLRRRV